MQINALNCSNTPLERQEIEEQNTGFSLKNESAKVIKSVNTICEIIINQLSTRSSFFQIGASIVPKRFNNLQLKDIVGASLQTGQQAPLKLTVEFQYLKKKDATPTKEKIQQIHLTAKKAFAHFAKSNYQNLSFTFKDPSFHIRTRVMLDTPNKTQEKFYSPEFIKGWEKALEKRKNSWESASCN